MWNLIKAQNYQIKRDNGIIYIYLIGALYFVAIWSEFLTGNKIGEITGSTAGVLNGKVCFIVCGLLVALLTARIMGWDYNDKTLNYELLAGHSRAKVFWSRVLVSMLWCLVTVLVLFFVPMTVFGILNGWGIHADLGGVLLHYTLAILPLLRFVCECVLLTVIMRNCYMVMTIGFVLYEFSWVIAEMQSLLTEVKLTTHFASTNVTRLLEFSKQYFGYIDGEDVIVYETALETSLVLGTIGVSLLVGGTCLLIAYRYFKKCDLG
ncbi:MAG: ABC transporter permease [Lachnospiraceae bacterium]|nr:ABC transporter permease [Lachnospiraceae bacterium]